MADINNNEKNMQATEFKELLKVYTEHSLYTYEVDADGKIVLDADGNPVIIPSQSELPPQTRVVAESLTGIQKLLEAKDVQLDERMSFVEDKFSELDTELTNKVNNNLDAIITSIDTEENRAKKSEKDLSDRIKKEKDRLDDFFKAAEVGDIAIDTLVEIQKWINNDETDTANLLIRIGGIEDNLDAEIVSREAAIETEQQRAKTEELRLADSIDKTNKTFRAECDILYNSLDAEANSRLTAYNELQSKINAEVMRSGQKDIELEHTLATATATLNSTIDNRITEESLARETGFAKVNAELDLVHTEVNKKIDNEISSCIDANNSLRNELYKEIADREDAIIKIQEKIGEEVARSTDYTDTKVKTLKDSISNNYYTREIINNFNSELHTNINTEAAVRATTDDALDKRITALEREVVLISCGNSKF